MNTKIKPDFSTLILLILFFAFTLLQCGTELPTDQKAQSLNSNSVLINQASTEATTDSAIVEKKQVPMATDPTVDTEYIMGKFNPVKHKDFVLIDKKLANRGGMYLRKQAYEDFKKMAAAAQKEGIKLTIVSATRAFDVQKGIWEGKWLGRRKIESNKDASIAYPDPKTRALKILEYSSMPGTSRHHWGTDIDINALTNSYFEKGTGLKVYEWLTKHAATYGYCQPYTAKGKDRPDGYNEEKWHWSYLPLSLPLTNQCKSHLKNEMISGFKGSEVATEIDVVGKYVLGINHSCQ